MAISSAPIAGSRAAGTRTSTREIVTRRYDAGQPTPLSPPSSSFGFTGFDFSARVHAERTTTFGDLFEEVFGRRNDPRLAPDSTMTEADVKVWTTAIEPRVKAPARKKK